MAETGIIDPLVAGGPDSQGALIVSITYSLMFIAIALGTARLYSSIHRTNSFGGDDICFYAALVLLIPQCVLTEQAVGRGIGQHADAVVDVDSAFKLLYTGQLLGVLVQGLSKASVVLLIARISRATASQGLTLYMKLAVGVWTLFSFLALALQCGPITPWIIDRDRCAAGGALYYVVIAFNLVTDAILAVYFIPGVMKLQMSRSLHLIISSLFAVRLIVCIASIVHLAVIGKFLNSTDPTWSDSTPVVVNEIVINLSLMTAGIPSIHSFLMELQTGQMGAAVSKHELGLMSSGPRSKGLGESSTGSGYRSKLSSGTGGLLSTTSSKSGNGFLGVRKTQRLTLKNPLDGGNKDGALSPSLDGVLSSSESKEELVLRVPQSSAEPGFESGDAAPATTSTTASSTTRRAEVSTSIFAAPPGAQQQHHNSSTNFVIDDDSGSDISASGHTHHQHTSGVLSGSSRMEVYQKTDIYVHEEYTHTRRS